MNLSAHPSSSSVCTDETVSSTPSVAQGEEPAYHVTERTHQVTRILFWTAFGVFLAVSIPHIAWVFRQYEPRELSTWRNLCWDALSYGYALAIDAVIGWLSHIKSIVSAKSREQWGDRVFTWSFLLVLVAMSWYFNWVFSLAHNPSVGAAHVLVWSHRLITGWGWLPALTIGQVTPIIISAMPVFIIAYTFILSKVVRIRAAAAKSLTQLEQEAQEAERRREAELRIQAARKGRTWVERMKDAGKQAIGAANELGSELQKSRQQPEKYQEMLAAVVQLFRDTPSLLEPHFASFAESAIRDVLHVRNPELARFWRLKAIAFIEREQRESGHGTPLKRRTT